MSVSLGELDEGSALAESLPPEQALATSANPTANAADFSIHEAENPEEPA